MNKLFYLTKEAFYFEEGQTKLLKPIDCALLFLLLLVVFAARSPFLFGPTFGGDAAYQAQAAVTVLHGGLLYRDVPYTYPPLYAYTEAAVIGVLGNTGLGWKSTAQIYDLGILVLIYLIVNRISNRKNALIAAALYGFSPLPFFATSSFASFDSTAVFWMLLSLLLLLMKKPIPSAVALGIGTAYKYFPILLLPAALVYLSTNNRQKIYYTLASVATFAVIQLPFILTDFNAWLNNVILFQLERPAFGASIFNLISLHPTLMDVQTQLTVILPIALLLVFVLMTFSEGKSALGLLKNSTLILLAAVFFSKVVLFYALWYIPLVCILIAALMKRASATILVPFVILQVALLSGWYAYYVSLNTQDSLILAYVYLVASGLLLAWLFYDRLIFAQYRKNR